MSMTDSQLAQVRNFLADEGTSAAQSIQIDNATGGTWTISYAGQTTSALAYNAGANEVQNALCALSNVGIGAATVVGTAPYVVYFDGALANQALAMLTVNSSLLTGPGVIVTVTQVTAGGVQVFSDAELNGLNDLASGTLSDTNQALFMTVSYGFRQLLANASKFNDYVAGQSQEKKSQIFRQIEELADWYQNWSTAQNQMYLATLMGIPPRIRAVPRTTGVPSTSLASSPSPLWKWRRNGAGGWWSS